MAVQTGFQPDSRRSASTGTQVQDIWINSIAPPIAADAYIRLCIHRRVCMSYSLVIGGGIGFCTIRYDQSQDDIMIHEYDGL